MTDPRTRSIALLTFKVLPMIIHKERLLVGIIACSFAAVLAFADDLPPADAALQAPVQNASVTAYQLQRYLMKRIPELKVPSNSSEWNRQGSALRSHILDDIVYHGWPREWIDAQPRFEQSSVIETNHGYRLRKYRYEIVPGFYSSAILYEPDTIAGRAPAILNVIGHEPNGNAVEYEQKRCINFAKRGVLALSLTWMGFGELSQPENAHDQTSRLDLAGTSAVGLFYLSMRRGLDFLTSLPQVDTKRLGVTGLSGGGWQTVVLSGLDERVAVAVEVAGFGSQQSNLVRPSDTNEVEESPTDFTVGEDYPFLVAMRAPRPTLLIHNAEDDCCFRADLVKPYVYEQVKPVFKLYGDSSALGWHENRDPGTHNYQLDNREQAYAFFSKHFHLSAPTEEIPSDAEIRTPQELAVGLPADNLTVAGLATRIATRLVRPLPPSDPAQRENWRAAQRQKLASVLRVEQVSLENAWRMANSKHLGLHTLSYRFDLTNQLSATGVWLSAISSPDNAPATIILNDAGYKASGKLAAERTDRGEQVLALDTIFNGATKPEESDPGAWAMMVTTDGKRPLGLEVEQLLAVARWFQAASGQAKIRVQTVGIRSQVVAQVAAALSPDLFAAIVSDDAIDSLGSLMEGPLLFRSVPELFCLDLYKYFDIDLFTSMAEPVRIERHLAQKSIGK
jgi:dienelactone hydrolase